MVDFAGVRGEYQPSRFRLPSRISKDFVVPAEM